MFDPPEDSPVQRFTRSVIPTSKKVKDQVFAFDRVFDENTTQSDVYEGTTRNLLDSVLDGYNATVFAYGATGCGKTHTITGTPQQPGIIFLTMQELFEKIGERSQDKTTELSLSYLEIYNETIRDLLVTGGSKQGLTLREDSNQAVTVSGLTSHHPKDVQEVMDMIVQGNQYRTVSPTEANAASSRSHAVLQINVAQKDRNGDVSEPHTMATLSIIDLAGSERASVTKNRGERLVEGANINKSLLALGGCINALCDRRQRAHVPYRNSKLTRLLKFSLGGNCKTVMIVCVSPSSAHFDESQNTLRYANRAKNIQTKVTRNVFNVNRHVKDFLVKIDEQMALINELKAQQRDAEKLLYAKFRKQCDKRDAVAREGMQRLRAAYQNSAKERQERVANMKRLRAFERRIGLLSGWIAAFDAVCDQRGDSGSESMPQRLTAVRKTAHGILAELEHSRQHLHRRLDKAGWERAMDTALTHSLKQLEGTDGADKGDDAGLAREACLLKAKFDREAYREVLEHDRGGDAAAMQRLMTAQLDMVASLADTLAMDEGSAVSHAKQIIHGLLQTGYAAASHVVQPDAGAVAEAFPPSRRGTPKRHRPAPLYVRPLGPAAMTAVHSENVFASPLKSSPRRRKALGAAKKGISFTPVKKTKGRGVRWRDDESEEGTLADFAKTPQKFAESSPERGSPDNLAVADVDEPDAVGPGPDTTGSAGPDAAAGSKPGRFQAGFLSKSSRASSDQQGGSPLPAPPTLSLRLASSPLPGKQRPQPLGALDAAKTGNMSPTVPLSVPRTRISPRLPRPTATAATDENTPIQQRQQRATSDTGSDSECGFDPRKLRNAMHAANKDKGRRISVLTTAAASNARRASSISSGLLAGGGERAGVGRGPGNALASSANGISRHRRGSAERRRSPPLSCSPTETKVEGGLTAGQARRMNVGGSLRLEGSPRGGDAARRVTISVGTAAAAAAHRRVESRGGSMWR